MILLNLLFIWRERKIVVVNKYSYIFVDYIFKSYIFV